MPLLSLPEFLGNPVVSLVPQGVLTLAPVGLVGGDDAYVVFDEEVGVDVRLEGGADAEAGLTTEGAEEFGHFVVLLSSSSLG